MLSNFDVEDLLISLEELRKYGALSYVRYGFEKESTQSHSVGWFDCICFRHSWSRNKHELSHCALVER